MQELSLIKKITKNYHQDILDIFASIPESDNNLFFVGGCIRNAFVNLAVHDIDFATSYEPKQIMQYLNDAKITVIPTGIEYGTVTAVVNKNHYEITTFRQDIQTDGRKAVVTFTKDIYQDSLRRDLTINSIYLDIKGNIYDPHNGINDLKKGIVQFIGDPEKRITEDFLRIMRFFRFYTLFGKIAPNQKILDCIIKHYQSLQKISKERITIELYKLIMCDFPYQGIQLMHKLKILDLIIGKHIDKIDDFNSVIQYENCYHLDKNFIPRILSILGINYNFKQLSCLLKLSKKQKSQLITLQSLLIKQNNINEILYYHNKNMALYWYIYQNSLNNGFLPSNTLEAIHNWQSKKFPITGNDLINLGFKPGEEIGKIIKTKESEWIASNFTFSKHKLLESINKENHRNRNIL